VQLKVLIAFKLHIVVMIEDEFFVAVVTFCQLNWYVTGMFHVGVGPSQNAAALQRYFDDQETQSSSSSSQQPASGSMSSFGLFSQLKEGAASIVKNVKDASAKVVETVS